MRANPDFVNYMRTTKGQNRCEFRKIQQTLKVASHKHEPVLAEVRPLDIKHHRGQTQNFLTNPLSPRLNNPTSKQE